MADRPQRKIRIGKVISNKMNKTIVVAVERAFKHHRYAKVIKRTKKLYAHDEKNQVQIGDIVKLMETRPLSKQKRWRLVEVLKKVE